MYARFWVALKYPGRNTFNFYQCGANKRCFAYWGLFNSALLSKWSGRYPELFFDGDFMVEDLGR